MTKDGEVCTPSLPGEDGFVGELQEAVDAIAHSRASQELGGQSARNSLLLCLKEIESVKKGEQVAI